MVVLTVAGTTWKRGVIVTLLCQFGAGTKRKRDDQPGEEDQGKAKIMAFARGINTTGRVTSALQQMQAAQKLAGHAVPPVPHGLHMDPAAKHTVMEVQADSLDPSSGTRTPCLHVNSGRDLCSFCWLPFAGSYFCLGKISGLASAVAPQ
jgi:hypothetical protein